MILREIDIYKAEAVSYDGMGEPVISTQLVLDNVPARVTPWTTDESVEVGNQRRIVERNFRVSASYDLVGNASYVMEHHPDGLVRYDIIESVDLTPRGTILRGRNQ